jgi:putative protease
MEVHLSTQVNITNIEALRFYADFADVIVLSRELTLKQVAAIHSAIQEQQITGPANKLVRIEMFCHGALCMAISGKCYLSLHEYNASANRGSCYQVCRRGYTVTDNESGRQLEVNNEYIMSPKDLCAIAFLDKMVNAGVRIFKIEGRARSAEYVKTVTMAYHRALQAIVEGVYTPELTATLTTELQTVFNRGFWDGYYQGARLGEWSEVYGNKANRRKTYIAKATNYFSRPGVAEFYVETGSLKKGDEVLIMGPTTGVVPVIIEELRVDLQPADKVEKGTYFSIAVPEKVRRADKLYKWESQDLKK